MENIPIYRYILLFYIIFLTLKGNTANDETDKHEHTSVPHPLVLMPEDSNNMTIPLNNLTLPLPPGYRKWEIPLHSEESWRVYGYVSIFIRSILELNEKEEELVLDTDFGIQWVDWRIFEHLTKEKMKRGQADFIHRTLDSDVLNHIWKPDVRKIGL